MRHACPQISIERRDSPAQGLTPWISCLCWHTNIAATWRGTATNLFQYCFRKAFLIKWFQEINQLIKLGRPCSTCFSRRIKASGIPWISLTAAIVSLASCDRFSPCCSIRHKELMQDKAPTLPWFSSSFFLFSSNDFKTSSSGATKMWAISSCTANWVVMHWLYLPQSLAASMPQHKVVNKVLQRCFLSSWKYYYCMLLELTVFLNYYYY